jgi:hypothetical protein
MTSTSTRTATVPVCPSLFSVRPRMCVKSLILSAFPSVYQLTTGSGTRLEFFYVPYCPPKKPMNLSAVNLGWELRLICYSTSWLQVVILVWICLLKWTWQWDRFSDFVCINPFGAQAPYTTVAAFLILASKSLRYSLLKINSLHQW